MSDNVIDIGELRIKRDRRYRVDRCKHMHLKLEYHGDIVTCDDCGKQISAFWALSMLAEYWDTQKRRTESRIQQAQELEQKTAHTKAAKVVEGAWRHKMAVCCPHCHHGILPEDRLGSHAIHRDIEMRRRMTK